MNTLDSRYAILCKSYENSCPHILSSRSYSQTICFSFYIGQIYVSGLLDAETQTVYSFKVKVTDGLNEIEIPVKITVKDVNDVIPIIKPAGDLIYHVNEDRKPGFVIVKLSGYDGDLTAPNNQFMLSISEGNDDGLFKLEQVSVV